MKNKTIFYLGIISIILLIILNILINDIYKRYTYNVLNNSLNVLVSKYPDIELEIMEILKGENKRNILAKYGLNKQNISELKDFKQGKIKLIIITTVIFLIMVFIFLICYFIYRLKIKAKINIINAYLKEILKGSYELNIANYNEDELSILQNDIAKIMIKLKELSMYEQKEKKFLMNTLEDISHQLKTPLTALMVTNDILTNNTLTKKEQKEFLLKQTRELEKMEWLITTLLKYSKLESDMVILKNERILASVLLKEVLKSLSIILELKNAEVITNNLDFNITCDINWTKEALINIIKNACEHINNNGKITITGEVNPLYQAIIITDNGVGISKKDIKNIFKRFYTTNSSKNSTGIGLNMAKLIMEKQKGKIEVTSEVGRFTTFKIIFSNNNI